MLITVQDVTAGKPDPEGYLLAARILGVPPARCLAVEDTETGLAAARSAGAMTAAVKGHRAVRGHKAVKGQRADLRLEHLAELADLLDTGATE